MYFARTEAGELLNVRDAINKPKEKLKCPACNQDVVLRGGGQKQYHFAHVKPRVCKGSPHRETKLHSSGKQGLFSWVSFSDKEAKLEAYENDSSRRPDVLCTVSGRRLALEYQCSLISAREVAVRSRVHEGCGYTPIWILGQRGDDRLISGASAIPYLSDVMGGAPRLIYFSPDEKVCKVQIPVAAFSQQRIWYSYHILPVHDGSDFDRLFQFKPKLYSEQLNSWWYSYKKDWRMRNQLKPTPLMKQLLKQLYLLRIPPSLIPTEIGLPVPYGYLLQNHTFEWQLWLYLNGLSRFEIGELVSFSFLEKVWEEGVEKGEISYRQLPLIKNHNPSLPLHHYLRLLERFGVIEIVQDSYIKRRELYIPRNLEEALEIDRTSVTRGTDYLRLTLENLE